MTAVPCGPPWRGRGFKFTARMTEAAALTEPEAARLSGIRQLCCTVTSGQVIAMWHGLSGLAAASAVPLVRQCGTVARPHLDRATAPRRSRPPQHLDRATPSTSPRVILHTC